jgi:ABC-type multidrug transport system fused ATPase/permease subunit
VGRLVIAPANQMASTYLWTQGLRASFEQIRRLLAEQPTLRDGARETAQLDRSLQLSHVSFSYDGRRVLHDVCLEIRKGEMLALVGPSGAGKSTLADLLLRLYDPEEGAILLEGVDIREYALHAYRSLFGAVPQDTWLFHDTIRANILYGRPGFAQEDVERAARIANAHRFITQLPAGYDTVIGDRGLRVSGGERQRLALARALLHRPKLLILDEATSALDSESERQVQEAIGRIVVDTTVVVIAHRLSTVKAADRIAVLDRGRVVAAGRHEELLGTSELYRRLCAAQLRSEGGGDAVTADEADRAVPARP